jgi:hypothetical protein
VPIGFRLILCCTTVTVRPLRRPIPAGTAAIRSEVRRLLFMQWVGTGQRQRPTFSTSYSGSVAVRQYFAGPSPTIATLPIASARKLSGSVLVRFSQCALRLSKNPFAGHRLTVALASLFLLLLIRRSLVRAQVGEPPHTKRPAVRERCGPFLLVPTKRRS